MFSNLTQNSILYILDMNHSPKVMTGFIEKVSLPKPKYSNFNPTMEMIVDITATVNGERMEFKGVPNTSIANFGSDAFVLSENRDSLVSYINAMLQKSRSIVDSVERHKKLISDYNEALLEIDPTVKSDAEKDKVINSLKEQMASMQEDMRKMMAIMGKNETSNTQ